MVLLYTPNKTPKSATTMIADILELDYRGLGVAKINGKAWFVENALPLERVQIRVLEEKRQYGRAVVQKILQPSPTRQIPKCQYYGICGGCRGQHISIESQREAKQNALFRRLAKLQSEAIEYMPMIVGEPWHYRRRLRLSLGFNLKTKTLNIGFRQKASTEIVNITQCEVIDPILNKTLQKLTALLRRFSQPKLLGHIELVAADNTVVLLLRHLQNLPEKDRSLLMAFAERENISLFVQDDHKIMHLYGELPYYQVDGLTLWFNVRDFIQVNAELNRTMVKTALDWLDLPPQDHVLDLFCGMGNFTLPLSRRVKSAVGIEGVLEMVHKAQSNAERNRCENVQFYQADLDCSFVDKPWATQPFNKILLDPPRTGAAFALNGLCALQAEKVLYVSCNPATLVRDAEILINFGYRIQKTAMLDMFPHTEHLESITLFEKK